jgi:hypothetical protein
MCRRCALQTSLSRAEQEIPLSSIRKFTYAALLAFTTLNFAPALASAQEPPRGRFTLPHDVRWENAVVPAGDYQFSIDSDGIEVLRLDKVSGRRIGFMFLVHDKAMSMATDLNRLVLEATPAGSYVSALQLPEYGLTLHFTVPASTAEKQIVRVVTMPSASTQ